MRNVTRVPRNVTPRYAKRHTRGTRYVTPCHARPRTPDISQPTTPQAPEGRRSGGRDARWPPPSSEVAVPLGGTPPDYRTSQLNSSQCSSTGGPSALNIRNADEPAAAQETNDPPAPGPSLPNPSTPRSSTPAARRALPAAAPKTPPPASSPRPAAPERTRECRSTATSAHWWKQACWNSGIRSVPTTASRPTGCAGRTHRRTGHRTTPAGRRRAAREGFRPLTAPVTPTG